MALGTTRFAPMQAMIPDMRVAPDGPVCEGAIIAERVERPGGDFPVEGFTLWSRNGDAG